MFSRTIKFSMDEKFQDVTENNRQHVSNAIGYLSSWAMHAERYSGEMLLYGDHEGNLNATYKNPKGEVTYSILGLRREDGSYSFHS